MTDDKILENVLGVIKYEAEAISDLLDSLDKKTLLDLVKAIAECRGHVVVSGCGASGFAARKIAHTFNCIERPAVFLEPSEALHGGLGLIKSTDILILLSKQGASGELVAMLSACKAKGALLVAAGNSPDSILGRAADIYLRIPVEREACEHSMLATSSILAVLSTFDAIAMAVAKHMGYQPSRLAVIHPGGAIGAAFSKTTNRPF